ncbi:MAG: hypothetical protein HY303_21910 [Candidatus Wallbacteria bacterium]|nr:hypothetical protein [Candidatus Wallbacteria bacterium]
MGAKLSKEEEIHLQKAIKEGKIHGHTRGVCTQCQRPKREMRFRGKPLTSCHCGNVWS